MQSKESITKDGEIKSMKRSGIMIFITIAILCLSGCGERSEDTVEHYVMESHEFLDDNALFEVEFCGKARTLM